jgi:hypothetical protein
MSAEAMPVSVTNGQAPSDGSPLPASRRARRTPGSQTAELTPESQAAAERAKQRDESIEAGMCRLLDRVEKMTIKQVIMARILMLGFDRTRSPTTESPPTGTRPRRRIMIPFAIVIAGATAFHYWHLLSLVAGQLLH